MSITPDEAAQEAWYEQLVDEISRDAISDFQAERLQSYYLTYRDVAKKAIDLYLEAQTLQAAHPGAALILFVTAAEVGLKSALLKPVIHGLVHNNAVAELVAELAITHTGFDRFKGILRKILELYAEIDFGRFRIEGHAKPLWEELSQVQRVRNALVHRAEPASEADAQLAGEVATAVLGNWIPSVLQGLGLTVTPDGTIQRR
jgi:hypothetical protein